MSIKSGKRLSIFLNCLHRNLESIFSFHGFGEGRAGMGRAGMGKGGKCEAWDAVDPGNVRDGQRLWLLLLMGCVHVD